MVSKIPLEQKHSRKLQLRRFFGDKLWKTSICSAIVFPQFVFCATEEEVSSDSALSTFFDPYSTSHAKNTSKQKMPPQDLCTDRAAVQELCQQELCCKEHNSRLQIGGDYTYVHLKPQGNPSFHGNLGGMQAIYEYRPLNRFYGGAKFSWKQGDTHGTAGKRSLLYIDVQERLGYTYRQDNEDWRITFFSGFGYRHFGQKLRPSEGNSLRFRYNEFYFPVGFLTDYTVNSYFSIGLDFTWMPQVYSTVTIVPLKGARWSLTNKLANFSVELPLTFALTDDDRFFLILKPFYERWQDGHTTAKLSNGTALGLPGNTYNFYGADLNFTYRF